MIVKSQPEKSEDIMDNFKFANLYVEKYDNCNLLLDFTIESEFICRLPKEFFSRHVYSTTSKTGTQNNRNGRLRCPFLMLNLGFYGMAANGFA